MHFLLELRVLFEAWVVIGIIQFLVFVELRYPLILAGSLLGASFLEATCHFLPCGSLHNMAFCPYKANRAFESLTFCL